MRNMDVPLLSQDEFFRHLNLQSVHTAAAKFHYRHALKERLRASSLALRKEREEKKEAKVRSLLETASPCRLLSPNSSNRLFGRPVIRREGRALNFETSPACEAKKEVVNGVSSEISILKPLLLDSRVFRHPGIKRELEELTKMNGMNHLLNGLEHPDHYCPQRKRVKIEIRHCYYDRKKVKNSEAKKRWLKGKEHVISYRVQSSKPCEAVEWERKMAAALTLFGHPRKSDFFSLPALFLQHGNLRSAGHITSASKLTSNVQSHFSDFKKKPSATCNNNNCTREMKVCLTRLNPSIVSGSVQNGLSLSPSVSLEKVSAPSPLVKPPAPRGSRPLLHRKAKEEPPPKPLPPSPVVKPTSEKTKSDIQETTFACPICQKCFHNCQSLMLHGQEVHLKCQFCGLSLNAPWKRSSEDIDACADCRLKSRTELTPIITKDHRQRALSTLEMIESAVKGVSGKKDSAKCHKCDICSKIFDRKSRMIRHITSCHAADLHKVDLAKFASNKKFFQSEC